MRAERPDRASGQYSGKAALDFTPVDWLSGRLTYRPSFRRISSYNTFAHPEHAVEEEDISTLTSQGQSVLLRKYDEGARDRQRVDLLLMISPTGEVHPDDAGPRPRSLTGRDPARG